MEDTTSAPWFNFITEMPGIFIEDMCPVFRTAGDQLRWEDFLLEHHWRYKYTHTVGTVGRVMWDNIGGHPYTGLFQGKGSTMVDYLDSV